LQVGEVLDDAVVDERELAVIGQVRVGVAVGGTAVGGPPGVADAGLRGRQRVGLDLIGQGGELSGPLRRGELAVGSHEGDAGGVVASVFEPLQPSEHDVERQMVGIVNGGLGYIAYDSTHEGDFTHSRPISCIPASHDPINVINCTRSGFGLRPRPGPATILGATSASEKNMTRDTMGRMSTVDPQLDRARRLAGLSTSRRSEPDSTSPFWEFDREVWGTLAQ